MTPGSRVDWPGRHVAHRVDEVVAADLLEHVARGARHDRGEERLVVVVRRQDQGADGGVLGPDRAADVDARAVRETRVEDGDVRAECGDAPGGLVGRGRLADDLDVTLCLEQLADPAPGYLVVVEEEDADRGGWSWRRRSTMTSPALLSAGRPARAGPGRATEAQPAAVAPGAAALDLVEDQPPERDQRAAPAHVGLGLEATVGAVPGGHQLVVREAREVGAQGGRVGRRVDDLRYAGRR